SGAYPTVALESKYSDGPWRREAQPLRSSAGSGILCTRDVLDLQDDEVWAIPTAFVAVLIDT
ncbi:MAG: hypothetical protein ACREP9_11050, partial [Candidatus Dormibacteraceae bacterium]